MHCDRCAQSCMVNATKIGRHSLVQSLERPYIPMCFMKNLTARAITAFGSCKQSIFTAILVQITVEPAAHIRPKVITKAIG